MALENTQQAIEHSKLTVLRNISNDIGHIRNALATIANALQSLDRKVR